MTFLHKGDYKPTTSFSFYPCDTDTVYILGLKSDEVVLSTDPFFQQNADGYLAIDDRFSTLYIQKEGVVKQRFDIQWSTECKTEVIDKQSTDLPIEHTDAFHPWMTVIGAGILTILVARMVFHEKD